VIDLLLQKCWVKIILFWINLKALKERTKTKGKEISEITELLTFDSVSGFLLSELNCVNFADLPVGNVFVVFFIVIQSGLLSRLRSQAFSIFQLRYQVPRISLVKTVSFDT